MGTGLARCFWFKVFPEVADKMLVRAKSLKSVARSKGSSLCGSCVTNGWQEMSAFFYIGFHGTA